MMTFRYHELIHMPFLIQLNLHSDNLDLTQRSTGDPSMSLPRTFQMWSVVQVGWRKKLTLEQREVGKNCWIVSLLKKSISVFFLKEFFFGVWNVSNSVPSLCWGTFSAWMRGPVFVGGNGLCRILEDQSFVAWKRLAFCRGGVGMVWTCMNSGCSVIKVGDPAGGRIWDISMHIYIFIHIISVDSLHHIYTYIRIHIHINGAKQKLYLRMKRG